MHGATVTRTVALVSPLSPSDAGVANVARKSAEPYSRSDARYVPVGEPEVSVARFVHVVEPSAPPLES